MGPALRLGLTGGIGSGKSTVARMLQTRGAGLIDADAIARSCTLAGGPALPAIVEAFGLDFLTPDGSMNRERMRELVFKKPASRRQLETIIHPLVGEEIRRLSDAYQGPCLVIDVPLLVESGRWRRQLDRVMVIDCTQETQVRRVAERNGWERQATEAILRTQSSRETRVAAADVVLFNDGLDLDQLEHLVTGWADRFGL